MSDKKLRESVCETLNLTIFCFLLEVKGLVSDKSVAKISLISSSSILLYGLMQTDPK